MSRDAWHMVSKEVEIAVDCLGTIGLLQSILLVHSSGNVLLHVLVSVPDPTNPSMHGSFFG